MKMKKLTKLLCLVLCLAMLFSLAACASSERPRVVGEKMILFFKVSPP